jgi:oxygen-independent coproporphyrinogen-3 oxidase
MDHFALPDDELSVAQSDGRLHRNFMGYTVQSAAEMTGFGMSSIGYLNDTYVQNDSDLESYEQRIEDATLAVYRGVRLSLDDRIRQHVITNLMCNFTLHFQTLSSRFGVDYHGYFAEENDQLEPFIADGLLERDQDGLTVTVLGRTFVRNIAMTFDAYLKNGSHKSTFSRTI